MKKNLVKVALTVSVIAIIFVVWSHAVGINKTIDKTVSVQVYEDNDGSYKNSSVTIAGNLKKRSFLLSVPL